MPPKRFITPRRIAAVALLAFFWLQAAAGADGHPPRTPAKSDKCPVCGMFVYKYPDWLAQIALTDGTVVFFDGAKDMFKHYFDLQKSAPSRKGAQIGAVYVTDYYSLKPIDARGAFFVVGSDIHGPMGKELIPLKERAAAEEFRRDHGGKAILTFGEVNPALIKTLD